MVKSFVRVHNTHMCSQAHSVQKDTSRHHWRTRTIQLVSCILVFLEFQLCCVKCPKYNVKTNFLKQCLQLWFDLCHSKVARSHLTTFSLSPMSWEPRGRCLVEPWASNLLSQFTLRRTNVNWWKSATVCKNSCNENPAKIGLQAVLSSLVHLGADTPVATNAAKIKKINNYGNSASLTNTTKSTNTINSRVVKKNRKQLVSSIIASGYIVVRFKNMFQNLMTFFMSCATVVSKLQFCLTLAFQAFRHHVAYNSVESCSIYIGPNLICTNLTKSTNTTPPRLTKPTQQINTKNLTNTTTLPNTNNSSQTIIWQLS